MRLSLTSDSDDDFIEIDPTLDGLVSIRTAFRGRDTRTLMTHRDAQKVCELLWMATLQAQSNEGVGGSRG